MVEPISAVAVETIRKSAKSVTVETLKESLKETAETAVKESPVQSSLETIENTSLETLKAQNEILKSSSNEAKSHYGQISEKINEHYNKKGTKIEIEPHGSRGPDIVGKNKFEDVAIGEIKSESEINRDLNGYWSQWNSDRSFGGKTKDYQLKTNYYDEGASLKSSSEKGWVSVIDGQLRGYCNKESISKGDLVVENYNRFKKEIQNSLEYLKAQNRITSYKIETDKSGIGYITINFK